MRTATLAQDLCATVLKKEVRTAGGIKARTFAMVAACALYERGYITGALAMLKAGFQLWRSDWITLQYGSGTGMMYEPIHPLDWCEAMQDDPADPCGAYSGAPVCNKEALWRMEYVINAVEALINLQNHYKAEAGGSINCAELHFHNELHAMITSDPKHIEPCPFQAVHR